MMALSSIWHIVFVGMILSNTVSIVESFHSSIGLIGLKKTVFRLQTPRKTVIPSTFSFLTSQTTNHLSSIREAGAVKMQMRKASDRTSFTRSTTRITGRPSLSATKNDNNHSSSTEQDMFGSFQNVFNAIGKTTSALVAITFFVVLAYQRDAYMVSFFIGAISNGILSKVLKKILKQARPPQQGEDEETVAVVVVAKAEDGASLFSDVQPSDNGMPSSHAMSLGFIGTYTALALPWTRLPLLVYVIISLIYRVQTKLHTWEQVAVGIVLGSTNGYLWRMLCLGENSLGINIMDWVSTNFLNDQGLLPFYMLTIPAFVGLAVVGSFERRISRFLNNNNNKNE